MEYIFLLYAETDMANRTLEERERSYTAHYSIMDDARARGVFRIAQPLTAPSTAVVARARGGKPTFMDGPFTETKEQLAGFYILDCADEQEARYWGGRISQTGCASSVEFRALRPLPARVSPAAAEHEPEALHA
jgi:hypothetical protein